MRRPRVMLLVPLIVFGVFFVNIVFTSWIVSSKEEQQSLGSDLSPLVVENVDRASQHHVDVVPKVQNAPTVQHHDRIAATAVAAAGDETSLLLKTTTTTITTTITTIKETKQSNRLPLFGTAAFNQTCGWTMEDRVVGAKDPPLASNCTLLARPLGSGGEGISAWLGTIVTGFIMAKQSGCTFKLDYAPGVDISDIWVPTSSSVVTDWRVPAGYKCGGDEQRCLVVWDAYSRGGDQQFKHLTKAFLAAIPSYRSPYGSEVAFQRSRGHVDLKKTMGPSFQMQTSMACTLGGLVQLSPAATKYQPNLYTTILPTLRDPNNFVIAVYIRTGHTEHIQLAERTEMYRNRSIPILDCALHVESTIIMQSNNKRPVVWMLITDSPYLKSWIPEAYSNVTTTTSVSSSSRRTILTTKSRGAHTKTRGQQPSTADFAEGILDWWLIGESDAVVADSYAPSFGNTAAFRGTGPYYKVPKDMTDKVCNIVEPAYKW